MWVRLVYLFDPDHSFQQGKLISVRVKTPRDLQELHKHSRILAAPYKKNRIGMATACKITAEIELTPAEIERLFVEGDRTIDTATGALCNVPDAERKADFDRVAAEAA